MAFSKAHRFDPGDYHYSLICRALAHPARLAILRRLHHHGKCEVKHLLTGLPISVQAGSQHLKILREMNIISCEQVFPTVIYWLNEDLPCTHQTVLSLLLRAGEQFDPGHTAELINVSRAFRALALGI